MKLSILGSSSRGNCYLLDNGHECLVVEAGIDFREVEKALNFDISRIAGVVISHEHGDHSRQVKKCLEKNLTVYMSNGTHEALGVPHRNIKILQKCATTKIGAFTILPFDVKHDAVEPFGFLIKHRECGNVLFATDTYYLRYKFKNLNNIMIECNYRQDILDANIDSGRLDASLRNRTIKSHMSLDTCIETLQANDLSSVNNIVLIHLSEGNSDANAFQHAVHDATGKTVIVAHKNMTINFDKTPF